MWSSGGMAVPCWKMDQDRARGACACPWWSGRRQAALAECAACVPRLWRQWLGLGASLLSSGCASACYRGRAVGGFFARKVYPTFWPNTEC